ncbi:MAG: hypothetical protein SGI77_06655 [Pirellulaceae bacterium]|nr:hypothetical protein [Pirellulaceae bacterium]
MNVSTRLLVCATTAMIVGTLHLSSFAQVSSDYVESGMPSFDQGMPCISGGMVVEYNATLDAQSLLVEVDDPAKIVNLMVIVHEKAIVSVNGEPTVTMGTSRPYIVRGLEAGKKYKFEIVGVYQTEALAEYAAKETVTVEAGGTKQVVLHLRRRNRIIPPPVFLLAPPPPAPVLK